MQRLLLFVVLLFSAANSFHLNIRVVWVVDENAEPTAVQLALKDLKRDWYSVLGGPPVILNTKPANYTGSVLYLASAAQPFLHLAKTPETYQVRTEEKYIAAGGTDLRGNIYAIYSVSEKFLGVQPLWWWADSPFVYQSDIMVPSGTFTDGPPLFEHRALFTNDEDLLGHFGADPLEESVFSITIWDKIYEALLRLKMNHILVGTVPLPDERSLDLAAKRGVIVGDHHFNLLGLDTFRWPTGVPYSFGRSKEVLEWMWKANINAQKKRETIWSVGYRGLNDHPFWYDDPGYNTDKERGALMTMAIANQSALLHKMVGDKPKQITFFWAEASELYYKGDLKFPEGVTLIWTDDGSGHVVAPDKVIPGSGLYYHVAMYSSEANQLTEGIHPTLISGSIGHMAKKKATSYMILNVSDLRPVLMTTWWAAKLVWDMAGQAINGVLPQTWQEPEATQCFKDWATLQYGNSGNVANLVAEWWENYFRIGYLTKVGENFFPTWMNTIINAIVIFDAPAAAAQFAKKDACTPLFNKAAQELVTELMTNATKLEAQVPLDRKSFFQFHSTVQIATQKAGLFGMLNVCAAAEAVVKKDVTSAKHYVSLAMAEFESLFAERRKVEQNPRWNAMWIGDHLAGFQRTAQNLFRFSQYLDKQEVTPMGSLENWYYHFYDYQCDRTKQYPLFYDSQGAADFLVRVTCSTQGSGPCYDKPYGGSFIKEAVLNMTTAGGYTSMPGVSIHYTINGTNPTPSSPQFDPSKPPVLHKEATVRAALFDKSGHLSFPRIPAATLWLVTNKTEPPPNHLTGEYGGKCPQGNH